MKQNSNDATPTPGRQDAYRARTHKSLLKSAHEVLADIGLNATIEDLAHHAQVSPATIYNHFDSKDVYLKEALNDIWEDWVKWAYEGIEQSQNLETTIYVCRKLFRIDRTHTLLGRVLSKTLNDSTFVTEALSPAGGKAFKNAAKNSGLEIEDFEMRLEIWMGSLLSIFQGLFITHKLSPERADKALQISLSIWGFSKTQAEKLTSTPINA